MAAPRTASVALLVFTRDLRVADNPALAAAVAGSARVLPLFVVDTDGPLGPDPSGRTAFLLDSLRDLDTSLRERGGRLVVRSGPWADEVLRVASEVGAGRIHLADDPGGGARRLNLLVERASALRLPVFRHPGVTVVPPGTLTPSGGREYKVFGAYHRAWTAATWRPVLAGPDAVVLPGEASCAGFPDQPLDQVLDRLFGPPSDGSPLASSGVRRARRFAPGGEREGTRRLRSWAEEHLAEYAGVRDDLSADATSRISPYLSNGCLSARQVASGLLTAPGGEAFVRQLCWRDFFHQVLAARPDAVSADYRDRGHRWVTDGAATDAWREGRTGYPVVDAAMRQLAREGFMHNRARMIVASFLTKDLNVDWRLGAHHFLSLLVDADLAVNQLNWQWVAGTGTDNNPHRIFNPTVQGRRFDPDGAYVRRYVPELAEVRGAAVHDPDPDTRRRLGYPPPIVDHAEAIAAYRAQLAIADARALR
ncbi:MAG: deoxyribodipyrimidine photo-lyase [Actinomycetota bacterium]|nr:deoxyribodipyrimidine photo-lyase [Actinomycetota bacterium]